MEKILMFFLIVCYFILLYIFMCINWVYSLLFFIVGVFLTYNLLNYYLKTFVAKRQRVKFRQIIRKINNYITVFLIISFYLTLIAISIYLGLYVTWFHGVLFFVVWFCLIFNLIDRKVYLYSVVLSYPFCYFIWIFYLGK
jgi:hypothetical protein